MERNQEIFGDSAERIVYVRPVQVKDLPDDIRGAAEGAETIYSVHNASFGQGSQPCVCFGAPKRFGTGGLALRLCRALCIGRGDFSLRGPSRRVQTRVPVQV
jgi:hypothetical protein